MLAIRNKTLNAEHTYALTGVSDIKRIRRVNGEKELSFTLEKTLQNAEFFDSIDKLWRVIDFNGEEYPVMIYRDVAEGDGYVRQFSCLHSFFDDMRNHVIYETFSGSKTFVDMMNLIFNGTDYTFAITDLFYAQEFENFGDDYALELFKTAIDRYGAEFKVVGKLVLLKAKIGNTTDFQYRHKFNLETIERDVDALDFSTYGRGYGKDGLEVSYTSTLAVKYGIRPIKPVRDERFKIQASLLDKVKQIVDNSLRISLTVKLSDLRASGYNKNHPDEGDVIILVDDRMGIKADTRIVEITEYFHPNGTVLDCDVTLSNYSNIFEQQRRIHKATKTLADAIEGKRPLPFEALAYAVQQATTALQNAQTELVFPDNGGILAVSKSNPNIMVLFNSAGIGVSQNGGQTFPEAITGYGINATVVTTGTLNTALVRIEGTTGKFYITGDEFKSTSLVNDKKFVRITPGEIYSSRGAMTIEREDGFKVIDNGYSVFDVNIQGVEPAFHSPGVTLVQKSYAQWLSTRSKASVDFNQYSFEHKARYLKLRYRVLAEAGTTAHFEVWKDGVIVAASYTAQSDEYSLGVINGFTLSVDLGVPTGAMGNFQIRIRSEIEGKNAYAMVSRKWLEG